MDYKCYIVFNDNYSYVGITNNLKRRIRQHNGIIKGGAKYTRLINGMLTTNWQYACYVDGFKTKKDALKFEWALKHVKPRSKMGIINRVKKLLILLNKPNWTKSSPSSIDYKLKIIWCELFLIPDISNVPYYIDNDFNSLIY